MHIPFFLNMHIRFISVWMFFFSFNFLKVQKLTYMNVRKKVLQHKALQRHSNRLYIVTNTKHTIKIVYPHHIISGTFSCMFLVYKFQLLDLQRLTNGSVLQILFFNVWIRINNLEL